MVHTPAHGRPKKRSKRNKRFLIICGALVTEVEYFNHVKSVVEQYCPATNWNVRKDVQVEKEGVDPLTLTEDAIRLMHQDAKAAKAEQYEPFDRIWAVTDIDDFAEKIRQAQDKADSTEGKVHLVISNPCFEVWIIDHARSCPLAYTTTPMCQELAKQLGLVGNTGGGHRNKHLVIDRIKGNYAHALKNAQQHMRDEQRSLRERHPSVSRQSNYAPWTDVPEVVETIIAECRRISGHDITDEL